MENLKGLTVQSVTGLEEGSAEVTFNLYNGSKIIMFHEQDCCESVYLEDVCGHEEDLIDATILHFEERYSTHEETAEGDKKFTFYDIQTDRGCVNLRWIGTSNGNYSVSVTTKLIKGTH